MFKEENNSKISRLNYNDQMYMLLYFFSAAFPTWFFWQPQSNDHIENWFAYIISLLYFFNYVTFQIINKNWFPIFRTYTTYAIRDTLLTANMAACAFFSIIQAVISHPRQNFKSNKYGLLESLQDHNIIAGALLMFMAIISWNQLTILRSQPFKSTVLYNKDTSTLDVLLGITALFTIIAQFLLISEHCSFYKEGCSGDLK